MITMIQQRLLKFFFQKCMHLTSTRARTGGVSLDRDLRIRISAVAATLLDRNENLRKRLCGLISTNIVVIIHTSGLVGRAVGAQDAGALASCEVR